MRFFFHNLDMNTILVVHLDGKSIKIVITEFINFSTQFSQLLTDIFNFIEKSLDLQRNHKRIPRNTGDFPAP